MRSEALKRAQRAYSGKLRMFRFNLHKDDEAALIDFLEAQGNMQAYLKGLVLRDMRRQANEAKRQRSKG